MTSEETPFDIGLVLTASELLQAEIPPREELIERVLQARSLAMISAWRGSGKTYLGLSMAYSLTTGTDFLTWKVPKARRCLYVDGELPAADLEERVRKTCGDRPPPLLELISSEFFYEVEKQPLILNCEEHQKRFLLLLGQLAAQDRNPEVLFFDNISSLTFGLDENSNSDQDPFLRFLLNLRHLGYTVVFFHHTGNSGRQRGATRREELLDICIKLENPDGASSPPVGNARFVLTFSKTRRKVPEPSELVCELMEDEQSGQLRWNYQYKAIEEAKQPAWMQCLRYIRDKKPRSQKEIVEGFKLSKGEVSKRVKDLREKGYLTEDLKLTATGESVLGRIHSTGGNAWLIPD